MSKPKEYGEEIQSAATYAIQFSDADISPTIRKRLKAALKTERSNATTPNGYDRRWVDAINVVLDDRREGDDIHRLQIRDLTQDLWDSFIGPMVDAIEDGDVEVVE